MQIAACQQSASAQNLCQDEHAVAGNTAHSQFLAVRFAPLGTRRGRGVAPRWMSPQFYPGYRATVLSSSDIDNR